MGSSPSAPLEFAAPRGRRVRVLTLVSFAIIPAASLANLALHAWRHLPPGSLWPMLLAPLVGYVVVIPVYFYGRVLAYRVTATELEIVRPRRVNRFAFAGLWSAEPDARAMEGSRKRAGNDGVGAITGRFHNARLGRHEVFVTDPARAVVLRWPDRTLVVSPDWPQEFAAAIRARAGIR